MYVRYFKGVEAKHDVIALTRNAPNFNKNPEWL